MKKFVTCLICLCMLLTVCLGCTATAESAYTPLTIHIMTQNHATMPVSTDFPTIKALEEKFNVTFEFELVNSNEYDEKMNVILAGGTLPDIFYANPTQMSQYYEFGIVRQLDDLLKEYAPNMLSQWESHDLLRNVKSDDGHYYYTTIIDESSAMECCGWINKTLLDECGLEVPKTYDELTTVLRTFKEK